VNHKRLWRYIYISQLQAPSVSAWIFGSKFITERGTELRSLPPVPCVSGRAVGGTDRGTDPRDCLQSPACLAEKIEACLPAAALRNVPGSSWSQVGVCLSSCLRVFPGSAFLQWQLVDAECLLGCSSNLVMMGCFLCTYTLSIHRGW